MKKRLIIASVVIGVCLLGCLLFTWRETKGFNYQGKSLKAWALLTREYNHDAQVAFQTLGSKAVPDLIRLLRAKDSPPTKLIWTLEPKLSPTLRRRIWLKVRRPDAGLTREGAARALAIIGPDAKPAIPALARALHDKGERVCWEAATALVRIGSNSVPVLTTAARDKDATVRLVSSAALGQIGPEAESAVPVLIQNLDDKGWEVRSASSYSLAMIGVRALPALAQARAHGTATARQGAQEALDRFNSVSGSAVSALIKQARDDSPATRRLAIDTMGLLHARSGVAVKALIAALQDPVFEVRLAAIRALGEAGARARQAIADLTRLADDPEASIRSAVKEALEKIQAAEP